MKLEKLYEEMITESDDLLKKRILYELNYDTISFRDQDGDWFEGIEDKDFDDLANRLVVLFNDYK